MYVILLRKIAFLMVAIFATVSIYTVGFADSSRRIGQTTVSAIPPDGFHEAPQFPGLVNDNLEASIVVIESEKATFTAMNAVFSDVAALNKQFASANIQMREIETIRSAAGLPIKIAHGLQFINGGEFEKWIALFQGEKTVMVTLQVKRPTKFDPAIAKSFFQSVKLISPLGVEEVMKSLSFNVEPLPPFHFSGNIGNAGIILMGGPDELNSRNDQPFILIFHMPPVQKIDDRFLMAETALRSTSTFKPATISSRREAMFAGLNGIELNGETSLKGMTVSFTQWFVLDANSRPLRMVAAGPKALLKQLEPEVQKIAESIKLRPM